MPLKHQLAGGFRLGNWLVNPSDGSVSSAERKRRLEPQIMDLLVFLCSRAGEVITKDEVLEAVWHGRFISEDTLKSSFHQLRKALGDSPRKPEYIETIPKRGYRLLIQPGCLHAEPGKPATEVDDLYHKGELLLAAQSSGTDLKQAKLYLEQVLETNTEHAEAAVALAHVYIRLVALGFGGGPELLPKVKSLASRAIETAPHSSAAYLALAISELLYSRDVAAAERSFRSAIQFNPAEAMTHAWYAKLLSFDRRHDDAVRQAGRAIEIDPLSLVARRGWVEALFMSRRYEETIHEGEALLRISSQATEIQLGLSWIYYVVAEHQKAFDAVYAGFRNLGVARGILDKLADAFRHNGIQEVFRYWANLLKELTALGRVTVDGMVLYALLGDSDAAFEMIDRVLNQSHPAFLWLPASPFFDSLRSDPRYGIALSQAGAR